MSLTLPTNYNSALASPFKENWIVQLYYDASNFTGISFGDTTVASVAYNGCILNKPTIRESIDVTKGSASSGNISLDCANFASGSDNFSDLIVGGSNTYLNQTVKIYSILNDSSDINDALLIYIGRLQSVSMDENTVKLSIVEKRPWDFVEIPNTKTNTELDVPVAYGNFTPNGLTGLTSSKSLYPVPFVKSRENALWFTIPKSYTSHVSNFFDKNSDSFPYLAQSSATTTTDEGKDSVGILKTISRTFRYRCSGTASGDEWTDTTNAYDSSTSSFATATAESSDPSTPGITSLKLTIPDIGGKVTAMTMYIYADVTESGASGTAKLRENSFGSATDILSTVGATATTSGSADPDGSGTSYSSVSLTAKVASNDDQLPGNITIEVYAEPDDAVSVTATGKVYDIYLQITSTTDKVNEPEAAAKETTDLSEVYIGGDGLVNSWDSSAITEIHEAHRDIVQRYLGITDTPNNWSALDSARSGWSCRYWLLEPTSIKKVLEQLAYEGGFVFRFRQDTPHYIHIGNSESADHSLTKAKINNLEISHTAISDLITKVEYSYEKHPAENKYISSATYTSSERSDYFTGDENVAQVELDALTASVSGGSNRNDSHEKYYDEINGKIKYMVSCSVIDPTIGASIEVGDMVEYGTMPVDPFGASWTSKVFIVVSTTKGVGGQVQIEAREI